MRWKAFALGIIAAGSLMALWAHAGPPVLPDTLSWPAVKWETPFTVGNVPQAGPHGGLTDSGAVLALDENRLLCGDFSTCPMQRGTSTFGSISTTPTYTADGWFTTGGTGAAAQVTFPADGPTGSPLSLEFGRPSTNTNTTQICTDQVLTNQVSGTLAGSVSFGLWTKAGANFSATTKAFNVIVGQGTGTNQSSTLFDTSVRGGAGWTGYTSTTTGGFASPAWTPMRIDAIAVTGTQLGIAVCYTPVGTAGADDGLKIALVYLGGTPAPTVYKYPGIAISLLRAQYFFYRLAEPASGSPVGICAVTSNNNQKCHVQFPVTMRAAPTCSITTGTFKELIGNTLTTWSSPSVSSTNVQGVSITTGNSQTSSTSFINLLEGGGGTGVISCSAEL